MKKLITIAVCVLSAGLLTTVMAQDAEQKVKNDAKKVGNQTAHTASALKSDVVDKKYEGKQGPHGEDVFIDKHSKYYYVDKKGHKAYVSKAHLRNRD